MRRRGLNKQIKNNPVSAEEQSLKFSVKVVNKTASSASQLTKCILLHAYSGTTASSQLRENKQKLHIAYLIIWHNCIFGAIEAENP